MRLRRAVVHGPDVAGFWRAPAGGRHSRVPLTRPPVRRIADAGGCVTRTRLSLEIVAAGAVAGIVGDTLLRAMPWGLNVALGTTALVGAGVWLVRRHHLKHGPDAAWLAITALLLGLAFLRRDAATLAALDALALIGALALAAASLQGELIGNWYILDLIRGVITATGASIFGGFVLLGNDIQWRELPQDDRLRNVRRVLWGVALATPLLLVFAALFASADQVFSNVMTNLFAFDAVTVISHTIVFGFWAFLVAGYLRWSFLGHPVQAFTNGPKAVTSVLPLATALGLLNALFLLFVVVQLRYFFGGAALVEETSGLTYAEYARRGFFELMTASGLVLPILLNPDAFIVKTNLNRPAAERPFDAHYALTLGGDAVPPLLAALPQLGTEDRCVVVHGLLARWDKEDADWRTWNWSRARARTLVRNQADALKASCPTKPKEPAP